MTRSRMKPPRFGNEQQVCFAGGEGTVKRCWQDSGTWAYAIKMELGPEPDMGRVGNETIVVLHEVEIEAVTNEFLMFSTLAA